MLLYVLVLLCEERGHVGGAAVGTIIRRVVRRTALLIFLVFFLEFLGEDVQFFDGIIVGIVPPLVLPVGLAECLFTKAEIILSSPYLNAIFITVLILTESVAFLPAHLGHHFLGYLTINADVGHT